MAVLTSKRILHTNAERSLLTQAGQNSETLDGATAKRELTSFLFGVHAKLVLQVAGCAKFSALITCELAAAEKVTRPSLQAETTHGRNVLRRKRGMEREKRDAKDARSEARKRVIKGGRGEGIVEEIKAARKK